MVSPARARQAAALAEAPGGAARALGGGAEPVIFRGRAGVLLGPASGWQDRVLALQARAPLPRRARALPSRSPEAGP